MLARSVQPIHRRWPTVLAAAALLAAAAWPGVAATLELAAPDHFEEAVCEAAAAFVQQSGHRVRVHSVPVPAGAFEMARQGSMDVIIPPCNNSSKEFSDRGWVRPETGKRIFCRRMAIILPRANPRGITKLADLSCPGLRVGSLTVLRPRVQQFAPSLCRDLHDTQDVMAIWARDADLLLYLLHNGNVDAALCWDTFAADDTRNFVVVRLPRSAAGDQAVAPITAFVTPGSDQPEVAQQLVDFLSRSLTAQDIFLKHGHMLDDGRGVAEYDAKAAPRFQKVYENICQQVIDDYGIVRGLALDIGCGPGQMAVALAQMTELEVVGVDIEPEAIEIAQRHAQEAGLADRCRFVCADAHSLPFADNCADLIVSRGTLPFLRDHVLAVREAYRVLKPGGVAFLGGGMGRYTPEEEAKKLYPKGVSPQTALDWGPEQTREDSIFPFPVRSFETLMTRAGITDYRVINEGGRWVEFRK